MSSDGLRAGSRLVEFLAPQLRADFYLADVGCSGGIDAGFRAFGSRLAGVGFDPNVKECERLAGLETQRIAYEAAFVAAPSRERYIERNPWVRLSIWRSTHIRMEQSKSYSNEELTRTNRWNQTALAERTIDLSQYLAGRDVDFFKIDIDGPDFDVMKTISYPSILGISMEVNFIGSTGADEHTFHNTDRFLRGQGFDLYDLSFRRFSLTALPGKYLNPHPSETTTGRPVQGDAIYIRDAVADKLPLSREKVIKLAGIFSLNSQHDAAAEVLLFYRDQLDFDVDHALDIIAGEAVQKPYAEHIAAFERDDPQFYTT
jgi:hypothetical protein